MCAGVMGHEKLSPNRVMVETDGYFAGGGICCPLS